MIKDFLSLIVAKPSKTWMGLMMIALAVSFLLGNSSLARSSGGALFAHTNDAGIALISARRVDSDACASGLEVNIRNTNENDMDAKVCIQLSGGDSKCSEYQQMTQGQKENALACDSTGAYRIFERRGGGADSDWVLVHEGNGW